MIGSSPESQLVEFGEAVEIRRRRLGIGIEAAAERIRVDVPSLLRWERGQELPDANAVRALIALLELPLLQTEEFLRLYRLSPLHHRLPLPSTLPSPRFSIPPLDLLDPGPTTDQGIFISYRRSDAAAFAGRLYDRDLRPARPVTAPGQGL
jgi:transcriptional regulator with XRE-family HTH domain